MKLKKLILLLIVILVLGIWFGINIGRDQPLLSNPFAEPTALQERVQDKAKGLVEDTKKTLREKLDEGEVPAGQ